MQTMGTTTQLGGSVLSAGPTGNGLVDKYVTCVSRSCARAVAWSEDDSDSKDASVDGSLSHIVSVYL